MTEFLALLGFLAGLSLGVSAGAYRLARAHRTFASAWRTSAEEARSQAEETDRMRLRVTHLGDQVAGVLDDWHS